MKSTQTQCPFKSSLSLIGVIIRTRFVNSNEITLKTFLIPFKRIEILLIEQINLGSRRSESFTMPKCSRKMWTGSTNICVISASSLILHRRSFNPALWIYTILSSIEVVAERPECSSSKMPTAIPFITTAKIHLMSNLTRRKVFVVKSSLLWLSNINFIHFFHATPTLVNFLDKIWNFACTY